MSAWFFWIFLKCAGLKIIRLERWRVIKTYSNFLNLSLQKTKHSLGLGLLGHARQKMGRVYAAPKPSMHRPFSYRKNLIFLWKNIFKNYKNKFSIYHYKSKALSWSYFERIRKKKKMKHAKCIYNLYTIWPRHPSCC